MVDATRLWSTLTRRGIWLVVPPLVLASVAFLVSDAQPRRYEAVATMAFRPTRAEQILQGERDNALIDREIKTEEELLNSAAYQQELESQFGSNVSVDADAVGGTNLMEIAVEADRPTAAATIANEVVNDYITRRRATIREDLAQSAATLEATVSELEVELQQISSGATTATLDRRRAELESELKAAQTALQLIETRAALTNGDVDVAGSAVEPTLPTSPQPVRSATLGAMLGLLLGLGLVWLREAGDRRLYSADDVLDIDGAVEFAGRVPKPSDLPPNGPAALLVAAVADRFKVMANNALTPSGTPIAVLITGARGGEGATYVAVNTAVTLAMGGWRTALVDANLIDGDIHEILDVDVGPGTADVLAGEPLASATQASSLVPGLHVVSRGSATPLGTVLNASLPKMINALRSRFDVVIIDGPAVLAQGDSTVLAKYADRTVLVVEAGRSTGPDVRTAIDTVSMGGGRVHGLVLTDIGRPMLREEDLQVSVLEHRLGPVQPPGETSSNGTSGTFLFHPNGSGTSEATDGHDQAVQPSSEQRASGP